MNAVFADWPTFDLVQRLLLVCAAHVFLLLGAWAIVGDRHGRLTQLDQWSHDNEAARR